MVSTNPPSTATSTLNKSDANLEDIELHGIVPKKDHHTSHDLEGGPDLYLKRTATNRSRRSVVIETNYEHPITDLSQNLIGWDDEDDPENPRNWPQKEKMTALGLVSLITMIS